MLGLFPRAVLRWASMERVLAWWRLLGSKACPAMLASCRALSRVPKARICIALRRSDLSRLSKVNEIVATAQLRIPGAPPAPSLLLSITFLFKLGFERFHRETERRATAKGASVVSGLPRSPSAA